MFDPNSRYYSLETALFTPVDGRQVTYVRRRILPQGATMPMLAEVTITRDIRLDVLTARTLGDPQQFWRICDANNAMKPADLTAEAVQRLKIPIPMGGG